VTGALWLWQLNGGILTAVTWVATVPDVGYRVIAPR